MGLFVFGFVLFFSFCFFFFFFLEKSENFLTQLTAVKTTDEASIHHDETLIWPGKSIFFLNFSFQVSECLCICDSCTTCHNHRPDLIFSCSVSVETLPKRKPKWLAYACRIYCSTSLTSLFYF